MKRLAQVIGCAVALGVTLAMAGCTEPGTTPSGDSTLSAPSDTASVTPTPTESGGASDLPTPFITEPPASTNLDGVDATGAFGEAPELTVPWPWAIDSTQTKILVQGDGPTVPTGGIVQVNYLGMNGRTGTIFDQSYPNGYPVSFSLAQVVPGFQKGLAGQKVGTRLIIAMPGADGYDASGGQSSAGIEIGDTLVFVVDIVRTQFMQPTGAIQVINDPSLPVVSDDLNAPTITMPQGVTPPTTLQAVTLIEGVGEPVESYDSIYVNYAEYIWDTGKMVRQTYGFSPLNGALSSTLPGWQQALVGKTIGSRLLLVVPPQLSYPQGYPKMNIPQGSTMVYVIDILYASAS